MKTRALDFSHPALATPEHESWDKHRAALLKVQIDAAGYRGCIGAGMLVDGVTNETWREIAGKIFLPNTSVRWLTIIDVPRGHFAGVDREVHWATIRPTTFCGGMPQLQKGSETGAWDFRTIPVGQITMDDGSEYVPAKDVLDPSQVQIFRALNGLSWAMTSTAFHFRGPWKEHRKEFFAVIGEEFDPDKSLFTFGENSFDSIARPNTWFPRPFLAFPSDSVPLLFARATRQTSASGPMYTDTMKNSFMSQFRAGFPYLAKWNGTVVATQPEIVDGLPCVAIQLRGSAPEQTEVIRFSGRAKLHVGVGGHFHKDSLIAAETASVPQDWDSVHFHRRWDSTVPWILGEQFRDAFVRIWFERQGFNLKPGLTHFSSELTSCAALSSAIDDELVWDVSVAMPYYNEGCDAFVFPTLRIPGWDALSGTLPGSVVYDITPIDPRYRPTGHKKGVNGITLRRQSVPDDVPVDDVPVDDVPVVNVPDVGELVVRSEAYDGVIRTLARAKKRTITVTTTDSVIKMSVTDDTLFYGVRGGGLKFTDDRIKKGANISFRVADGVLLELQLSK